jgi:hypothetical protein
LYWDEVGDIIQKEIKSLSMYHRLDGKKIFLFGRNIYTERINNFLHDEGYRLDGILDNDTEKQGKTVADIMISAPENIDWKDDVVVLIASKYYIEMKTQIQHLSCKTRVFSLFDFEKYFDDLGRRSKFWIEDNFDIEIKKLQHGAMVYDKIKNEEQLVVFPTPSIGDIYIGCLCINAYEKETNKKNIKIVISSKGVYQITQMFGMDNVVILTQKEVDDLTQFLFYDGKEDMICSWRQILVSMATYKKILYSQYWAKYFFGLENDCLMNYSSIHDKILVDEGLEKQGLKKGRTIILAPYANTVEELPFQFWEYLVEKLLEMDYMVITNVVGNQKPIKDSIAMEIPLNQIGTYLEYSGYFISIRNGLCDVIERSKCRKIIICRNRMSTRFSSEMDFFELHSGDISKDPVYCLYDDAVFFENIQLVIDALRSG